MKKKIILSLVIVLGLFMVTGCGKKEDNLKGKWKAIPSNQNVYQTDLEETVGGKEDYFLECNGKGSYELKSKTEDYISGTYKVLKNKVTFYDEGRSVIAICKIDDKELDCSEKSYYAFKYTKVEK
jgi:hypothetical protein